MAHSLQNVPLEIEHLEQDEHSGYIFGVTNELMYLILRGH